MLLFRQFSSTLRKLCEIQCKSNNLGVKFEPPNRKMSTNITWIDLEMTGLNVNKDKIIEIACLMTNSDLEIISSEFHEVIHQSDEVLNNMDEWCRETHGKTKLTDAVRASTVTIEEAEIRLLNFIKTYVTEEKTSPLAGNTIYMDRLFLMEYMPKVNDYLHYRIIDVSSIKELTKRWYPNISKKVSKSNKHRALDDITSSINELKLYKQNIFVRENEIN